jgi:hypothetical protein
MDVYAMLDEIRTLGVCCRAGIASGIDLLWNPWQRNPKAYRMSVAMLALPVLKPAPLLRPHGNSPGIERSLTLTF